jgi:hypothetical protein
MRMEIASSCTSTASQQSCTACSTLRETGCWSANLPATAWDSYRLLTQLQIGSAGRNGNGKKICRHGFLRRGISSFRANLASHANHRRGLSSQLSWRYRLLLLKSGNGLAFSRMFFAHSQWSQSHSRNVKQSETRSGRDSSSCRTPKNSMTCTDARW